MRAGMVLAALFFGAVSAVFSAEGDVRVWKSEGGAHTMKAEYLGKKGVDKIFLLKSNGRVITAQLEKLSEDDRNYVENQENPELSGSEMDKNFYKACRAKAKARFDEIGEFRQEEDFRDSQFDPAGPYYGWKLRVKKLQHDIGLRLSSESAASKKTNAFSLAAAVKDLAKLGDEYDKSEGKETNASKELTTEIQRTLDSLTDDPKGKPKETAEEEEENPFDEEVSGEENPFDEDAGEDDEEDSRVIQKNGKGPGAIKPNVKDKKAKQKEEAEDEGIADTSNAPEKGKRRSDKSRSGGDPGIVSGLLGAFSDLAGGGDGSESLKETNVTYSQYQRVKTDMTKEEVFAILGEGNKINVPLADMVAPGMEVYFWENDDLIGGCEVTFIDGKVDHKGWSGSAEEEKNEEE